MAFDRQGTGLAITRICLGVFFIVDGASKFRWLADSSILLGQLQNWLRASAPGSTSRWYLEHVAMPRAVALARVVPLGEVCSGVAILLGAWTSFFAFIAFFMVLNFHIASGAIFRFSFLTNSSGLPVLGPTLGLAIGGRRLPWSIRS